VHRFLIEGVIAFGASLILAASAQISIPIQPVPFTLQTLAVTLLGAFLGSRRAAVAVTLYLVEGSIGMPVFAEWKAGAGCLVGVTGGYLIGFVPAAWFVGLAAEHGYTRRISTAFLSLAGGTAIILGLGTLWLAYLAGPSTAVNHGLLPFLPGALAKTLLAVAIVRGWSARRTDCGGSDNRLEAGPK